jgi:hypothetical protein
MHILNVQVASRCLLVHDIGLENIVAALPHLIGAPSVIARVSKEVCFRHSTPRALAS